MIPSAAQTKTLVLSDITVCKLPGTNPATYDARSAARQWHKLDWIEQVADQLLKIIF